MCIQDNFVIHGTPRSRTLGEHMVIESFIMSVSIHGTPQSRTQRTHDKGVIHNVYVKTWNTSLEHRENT